MGHSIPEDDIHDEAVSQQPSDAHRQVKPYDGDLEPKRQEGTVAGIEQQMRGQPTVVGAQKRQVALKVAAIEDLPEWSRKERLHTVTLQSHSAQNLRQGTETSDHGTGLYLPNAQNIAQSAAQQILGPPPTHGTYRCSSTHALM